MSGSSSLGWQSPPQRQQAEVPAAQVLSRTKRCIGKGWKLKGTAQPDFMERRMSPNAWTGYALTCASSDAQLPAAATARYRTPLPQPAIKKWRLEAAADIGYKYQEVVRRKADREMLLGHTCPDCAGFYVALASWSPANRSTAHDGGRTAAQPLSPACGHGKRGPPLPAILCLSMLYTFCLGDKILYQC